MYAIIVLAKECKSLKEAQKFFDMKTFGLAKEDKDIFYVSHLIAPENVVDKIEPKELWKNVLSGMAIAMWRAFGNK